MSAFFIGVSVSKPVVADHHFTDVVTVKEFNERIGQRSEAVNDSALLYELP